MNQWMLPVQCFDYVVMLFLIWYGDTLDTDLMHQKKDIQTGMKAQAKH